jgi:hypothetical protein
MSAYDVHPREKLLRGAIKSGALLTAPAVGLNFAPWHALVVAGIVCAALAGTAWGVVALFYAVWCIGTLGDDTRPDLLIGEGNILCHSSPYWPWSRPIKRLRRAKRIAELERANGVPPDQRWANL